MPNRIPNIVINLFLLLAVVGILDAGYITLSHLAGGEAGCFLVEGCNQVLSSPYAEIFGLPTALYGLIYYFGIFVLSFLFIFRGQEKVLKVLSGITIIGFVATLWFLYLQTFVLNAFCSYCLISAITSISLFILGIYSWKRLKRGEA